MFTTYHISVEGNEITKVSSHSAMWTLKQFIYSYLCVYTYVCGCQYVYYMHAGFTRPEESVCTSGAGISGCLMLPNGRCLNLNLGPRQEPIHANYHWSFSPALMWSFASNQTISENSKKKMVSKRTNYGYNLYGLNCWAPLVTNYVPVHGVRSLVWVSWFVKWGLQKSTLHKAIVKINYLNKVLHENVVSAFFIKKKTLFLIT